MKRILKKYLSIRRLIIVLIPVALIGIFAICGKKEDGLISERIYIEDVYIGGMTKEKAISTVEEYVSGLSDKEITFQAGENELKVTAGELGISWGNKEIVEEAACIGKKGGLISRYIDKKKLKNEDKIYRIHYDIDEKKLLNLLESNGESLNTKVIDAQLKRENKTFIITPESQGFEVNTKKSVTTIEQYFSKEWKGQDTVVELVVDTVKPKRTEKELSQVKDLLGSYQTSYSSSNAGRRQNLENGTSKINGIVVYPQEVFSVYDVASPFVKENGYAIGGAYENGTVIESYGGGICQVSTTLYNAVIRAELEVVERYPHSMVVSYVEPSEDAAIAGTYKDFKFKNNTDAPIYIEGYMSKENLCFNIYGKESREKNRKVEFQSEILTTTEAGVKYQAAEEQPIGYMNVEQAEYTGYTARLWKIVTIDGVEKSREVFNRSNYKPSAKIVSVGIASANGEAIAAILEAIATQNEEIINMAIAQWNDEALAAANQEQTVVDTTDSNLEE